MAVRWSCATTVTYIQWRYVGEDDDAWRNLAALSDLVGPAGRRPVTRTARRMAMGRCRRPGGGAPGVQRLYPVAL